MKMLVLLLLSCAKSHMLQGWLMLVGLVRVSGNGQLLDTGIVNGTHYCRCGMGALVKCTSEEFGSDGESLQSPVASSFLFCFIFIIVLFGLTKVGPRTLSVGLDHPQVFLEIRLLKQDFSQTACCSGIWPRSRRLGLKAVLRPTKASASVSARTDYQTPQSQSPNQGSWYWSRTVRPREQVIFSHKCFIFYKMP